MMTVNLKMSPPNMCTLTRAKEVDHITPALYTGFLSVKNRSTRSYCWSTRHWMVWGQNTADLLPRYEPSRPLRSSGTGLLSVPGLKTKHEEAVFSYYAPHIWNRNTRKLQVCSNSHLLNQDWRPFCFATSFHWSNFKALNVTVIFIL